MIDKFSSIFKLAFKSTDFRKLDTIEKYRKKHQNQVDKIKGNIGKYTSPIGDEGWSHYSDRTDQLTDILTANQQAKLDTLSDRKKDIIKAILAEGRSSDEFSGQLSDMDDLSAASQSDYNWGAVSGLAGTASGIGAIHSYPAKLRTLLLGLGALGGIGYGVHRLGKGADKSGRAHGIHEDFLAKARARAMGKEAGIIEPIKQLLKNTIQGAKGASGKAIHKVKDMLKRTGKPSATLALPSGSTKDIVKYKAKPKGVMARIKAKVKGPPQVMGEGRSKVKFRRKDTLQKAVRIKDEYIPSRATKGGVQDMYNRTGRRIDADEFSRKMNIADAHSGKWKYTSKDGKYHKTLGDSLLHTLRS